MVFGNALAQIEGAQDDVSSKSNRPKQKKANSNSKSAKVREHDDKKEIKNHWRADSSNNNTNVVADVDLDNAHQTGKRAARQVQCWRLIILT